MALETVTYITDLVKTNPVATDNISQGDDHIRNIKKALENSFDGFTGATTAITEAQLTKLAGLSSGEVDAVFVGAFGSLFRTVDVAASTSWVTIGSMSTALETGVTNDASNGTITIDTAGTYLVTAKATTTAPSTEVSYKLGISINGDTPAGERLGIASLDQAAGASGIQTITLTTLRTFSATDVVKIQHQATSNSVVSTDDAYFEVHRVA